MTNPLVNLSLNLNLALLRRQKLTLLNMTWEQQDPGEVLNDLDGLINLLDHIQDAIVSEGYATELEVFGPLGTDDELEVFGPLGTDEVPLPLTPPTQAPG